jgi:alpha-ribazole phosphatase
MKLWLVRHAQPLIAPGICYGRLDMAADAAATAECARQLAIELPAGIRIAASPRQRCNQLAIALQTLRPDLTYQTDARLQEMDFGRWEGRAWQDIDPAELQAWTDNFAGYAAGHTGESVSAFMARIGAAFDALEPPQDTLWITHAGVIRAAGLLAQGRRRIEHAGQWPLDAPKYGQWQTLDWPTGPAQVAR